MSLEFALSRECLTLYTLVLPLGKTRGISLPSGTGHTMPKNPRFPGLGVEGSHKRLWGKDGFLRIHEFPQIIVKTLCSQTSLGKYFPI